MMATQLYNLLHQQMAQHQRAVDAAACAVRDAQTLMDIVRQINQIPNAPVHIRCLAQIRSANTRLRDELQRKAEQVIQEKILHLQAVEGTEGFCQEMRTLRRDLRYLNPALPVVVWKALQELDRLQRAVERPPADRCAM